jgi:flagellar hook assembly protein FlgD
MQNVVYNKVLVNTSVQIDSLGSGQWWWQVTPYYELNSIGYAGASKIASLEIERTEGITPPSLTLPLQAAEIHYKDTLDVNFSWKSDIKASYELLISADKDFKDIITKRKTAGQRATVSLALPEKEGQSYYWKVIRNSSEPEDFNPESSVREFTVSKYVSVPTKLLYPPEEFSTETTKVSSLRFSWKPSDEAKANARESTIQISSSRDFNTVQVEKTVAGTNVENLSLPSGDWYWRVATEGRDGELDYTQPNHLVVQKELTAPSLTNIIEDTELLVAKDGPVKLKWTPVQGADYYNIKVYDSANKLVAEKANAEGTSANFLLPDDDYSVKIQAVASQTAISPLRTGPVQTVDFTVRTPDLITAVSPTPSARIDGLNALRNPVNFSWKAGRDKAATTELVLKKRLDDGSLREVERIKTSKTNASVSRLTSGTYTWQIVASTSEGLPINSEPVSFTVTPVASLSTPLLMAPKHNFTMDSSFLKKNRSISFEWKDVPDATEYNIVIYRKDKNGTLIPVYSEKGIKSNKLKFKNLALLDVGEFEWDVTAFSMAKDGYEERRSQVARANFKVKFDSPKQITTEKINRMFSGE